MSFCQLHWKSEILRKETTTWVLVPDRGTPPFPVFYLLHGLSDDHTTWMRQTRIEAFAAPWPFIIVMPDGGRGWYTNHANGPQWAVHMVEELPAMIERTFPAKTTRESRCIGGLSMGGYGALRLALGYPDRYASANSHSGAVFGPTLSRGVMSTEETLQVFGTTFEGSEHDLTVLAKRAKATAHPFPKLRIDCGVDDHLLEPNHRLHRELLTLGVEHEYEANFPGGHNWDYWNLHITKALAFHAKSIGLDPID